MHRTSCTLASIVVAFSLVVAADIAAAQAGRGGGRGGPPINASTDPHLTSFRWRSIGPANPGGRVDDIAVSDADPNTWYVGFAVSGVYKTENAGVTWRPIFETYGSASIGDLAAHPANADILYVGTGEPNNRQSSSFGDGMYKTTDGGQTFQHIGLRETQTISRIVIDPRNPEMVYVAANGPLFGPSEHRGVYKSADGGATWNKVKYIDENTGFTDIVMDPANSNTLYAASYQRRRAPWGFNGGGPGSGIWKTTDGGRNWAKLSGGGLPPNQLGRIALDVTRANANVIYAQIEVGGGGAAAVAEETPDAAAAAGRGGARAGGVAGAGRGAGAGAAAGGGRGGGGGGGGGRGGDGPTRCNADGAAENFVFPPPIPNQSGVWRSADKGRTWTLMSNCNGRPMYFSQIRADPSNENIVFIAELPWKRSMDGGRTFVQLPSPGHVDQHAMWINPRDGKHVMVGNDGGFSVSRDRGDSWYQYNNVATTLFYQVSVDMRHPYYVCGGLQDNSTWCGPSSIRGGGRGGGGPTNAEWFQICGGDGFYTAIDPNDFNTIYCESQNGNISRYDLASGRSGSIRPNPGGGGRGGRGGGGGGGGRGGAAGAGAPAAAPAAPASPPGVFGNIISGLTAADGLRWNWNTPFMISHHDTRTVLAGSNRFHKSTDRGQTWTASPDLTKQVDRSTREIMGVLPGAGRGGGGGGGGAAAGRGGAPTRPNMISQNDGVSNYGTISTVGESPVVPGIYWAGTDDGNVQVSRDGGTTWTNVTSRVTGGPGECYVSRVEPSRFDAAAAYVSFDCHRNDDHKPYVFVTRDYGQSWRAIVSGLPTSGHVNVVKEDLKNPNLLFAGTEYAFFVSTDAGAQWKRFMNNLPTVRIDDVVIHPREQDLVLGTHGRAVWVLDDITPLQQLTPAVQSADVHLFDLRPAVQWVNDLQLGNRGRLDKFTGENAPRGVAINYYLRAAASGDVTIRITDTQGQAVYVGEGSRNAGINRVMWAFTRDTVTATGRGGAAPAAGRGGGGGGGGGRGGGGGAVEPGTYLVTVTAGGKSMTKPAIVLEDVWLGERKQ